MPWPVLFLSYSIWICSEVEYRGDIQLRQINKRCTTNSPSLRSVYFDIHSVEIQQLLILNDQCIDAENVNV